MPDVFSAQQQPQGAESQPRPAVQTSAAVDLEVLRRVHRPIRFILSEPERCAEDQQFWPCDMSVMGADLDQCRQQLAAETEGVDQALAQLATAEQERDILTAQLAAAQEVIELARNVGMSTWRSAHIELRDAVAHYDAAQQEPATTCRHGHDRLCCVKCLREIPLGSEPATSAESGE